MARARLARAGGCPKGFHATNTRIEPTRRIDPNPLKKYPKICLKRWVGGGEGVFLPFCSSLRWICSVERPCVELVDRRWITSSVEMVCQSRLDSSRFKEKVSYVSRLLMMFAHLWRCGPLPCWLQRDASLWTRLC